jgi:hypothetical protein
MSENEPATPVNSYPPTLTDPIASAGRKRARGALLSLIVALFVGKVAYKFLVYHRLEQTSALFIGLPVLLALALAFAPGAKSATGTILRGISIALCLSGILLGEGFICILMAAPLFLLVGALIGGVIDYTRRRDRGSPEIYSFLFLPFLLVSVEGINPSLSFDRAESVTEERIVVGSEAEVRSGLEKQARFNKDLPPFLRLKFPRPLETAGEGLVPGSERSILFGGGEGKPGVLIVRLEEAGPRYAKWRIVSDRSHIAHWLDWKTSEVDWSPAGPGRTRVRWTMRYERRLDPAWYFGPWERYAVRLSAGYMIENLATPDRTQSR